MELNKFFSKQAFPVGIGFVIWLLQIIISVPYSPFAEKHIHLILFGAVLFLLPMSMLLQKASAKKLWSILAAAILFTAAFYFPKGIVGVLLVIPWLLIALYETWLSWKNELELKIVSIVKFAANAFWIVAASWA
ncbi:MAG: hypothetical protein AB8F74_07485, partial [Saprospiraceae bacterium]